MLPLNSLIFFLIFDAILINCGIIISFYLKFRGNVPDYNLQGYEGLYIFLTFSYFIGIFINGLYKKPENISYYKIIKNSVKSVIISTLLSMMFGYILRSGRANSFPASVFILSIFINSFILIISRALSKSFVINVKFYNKLIAFILNRIPETLFITAGIYVSYLIKFRTLNIPEYNFSPFGFSTFIICVSYYIFIYKFLLYKYSREQSNISVLYVTVKTTIASFITGSALLFIFREKVMGFPSSVYFISCIINYFSLAIWHILIRRGFLNEIEVDLDAEEPEDENCADAGELPAERDGFSTYFRAFHSPTKFIESFKNFGSEFFNSSVILFLIGWWMILVYMVFMPDYLKNIIIRNPDNSAVIHNGPLFSNITFLTFAITVGSFYILWCLLNHIILKFFKKENMIRFWAGSFYIFSLNIVLYLIWIISGNFFIKPVSISVAVIIFAWLFILNAKLISKIFDVAFFKSIIINLISLFLSSVIITVIIFYINK
ncbi:hypothetical protein KA977_04770 [Candidatus Dependentiae bacterium]|nr:hypothetical protein [Candidatus Dependentiae bacterium]